MNIIVLGAGVIGVMTAYTLAKSGHNVTVIDQSDRAAQSCSLANGGQLSFGFAMPMASARMISKIPAVLAGRDKAFKLPLIPTTKFLKWSAAFLQRCNSEAEWQDQQALTELCLASKTAFETIKEETGLDFDHRDAGKLVIYKTQNELNQAIVSLKANSLIEGQVLDFKACLDYEPALKHLPDAFSGGIYYKQDQLGDCSKFTEELANYLQTKLGVVFRYSEKVLSIEVSQKRAKGVKLATKGLLTTDAVICCLGAQTDLLDKVGVKLPILPIYGYSLTLPVGQAASEIAISDLHNKMVCSRLGDRIRIAGFADFGEPSTRHKQKRLNELLSLAQKTFPLMAKYDDVIHSWMGARPSTPNSLPYIGQSDIAGLYTNMGHGMFGWTLAAGSAQLLAEEIGLTKISKLAA